MYIIFHPIYTTIGQNNVLLILQVKYSI